MKYILAIWVIIVLIGLLLISLINLEYYGTNGIILAGISAFALYRVFRFVLGVGDPDSPNEHRTVRHDSFSDPLEYIIYGDIAGEAEPDDWDDY